MGLHGVYGLIWVLKDISFPDKTFQPKVTIFGAFFISLFLIMYWIMGYIQIMGLGINEPSNSRIVTTIFMFVFGTFMMVVSDAQKFFTLQNKPGLISEGMFKITRNPNYFGELMIYFSFAACTGNLISYAILLAV